MTARQRAIEGQKLDWVMTWLGNGVPHGSGNEAQLETDTRDV